MTERLAQWLRRWLGRRTSRPFEVRLAEVLEREVQVTLRAGSLERALRRGDHHPLSR